MAQSWHPFQLAEDHLQRIVLLLYNYLYFEYHHWLNIFTALWCWDCVRHVNYDSGLTCTTLLRESFLPTAFAENIHFWLNYKTPHPNHLPILAKTDWIQLDRQRQPIPKTSQRHPDPKIANDYAQVCKVACHCVPL